MSCCGGTNDSLALLPQERGSEREIGAELGEAASFTREVGEKTIEIVAAEREREEKKYIQIEREREKRCGKRPSRAFS